MRLDNYILEESQDNIKILILTSHSEDGDEESLFKTAKSFKKICEKRQIPYYVVFSENAYITKNDDGESFIHNLNDKKGLKISKHDTVAIVRGSVSKLKSCLNLLTQLEKNDIFCINNRQTIEECSDKFRTALKMADVNLYTPKTALISNEKGLKDAFERIDGKFPIILKTLTGSKGIGVFKADSWEGLKSTLQTIWKINPDIEILLQEYIDAKYDIRVHVLDGKVIAAMKRFKVKNDFRSNYSLGGIVKEVKLTKEQEETAILAANSVGGIWVGVDIIISKDKTPFIIEINSSPGTEGIIKATNKPIIDEIINFILDKKNWRVKAIESGRIENVYIDTIGYIKAKMDTGNSAYCVIHADKWDIKDNYVTWTHLNKEYEHKLEKIKKIRVGGYNNYIEERPVILLDVTFNNNTFKNIKFTLSDRKELSPLLLNKRFIILAGLTINPAKKYILSKENPEEKVIKESKSIRRFLIE